MFEVDMLKVMIANNMEMYLKGKSDGITFKDVTSSDYKQIKLIAEKYNKQLKVIDMLDPVSFVNEPSETITKKVKKIFITNGKETIKINPDLLQEYMAKGYRTGRK